MKTLLPIKSCGELGLFQHGGFVYAKNEDVLACVHYTLLDEPLPPYRESSVLDRLMEFVDSASWRGAASVAAIREACRAARLARSGQRKKAAKAQFEAWCAKNPNASVSKRRVALEKANANIHACFWLHARRDGKLVAIVDDQCIELGLVTYGDPDLIAVDADVLLPWLAWLVRVTKLRAVSVVNDISDRILFGHCGYDSACIVVPSAHLQNRPRMR